MLLQAKIRYNFCHILIISQQKSVFLDALNISVIKLSSHLQTYEIAKTLYLSAIPHK